MRQDAQERIEQLSDNDKWLFAHMLVSFWFSFGIGNGLTIRKEDIEVIKYRKGPQGYRIKKEVMQQKLAEYVQWLERYKKTWGTDHYDCPEQDKNPYEPVYESMKDITKMIELLQV